MSFTLDAAEKLDIPEVMFYTTSACGFMGYLYYSELVARGYVPFKGTVFLLGNVKSISWFH